MNYFDLKTYEITQILHDKYLSIQLIGAFPSVPECGSAFIINK